MVPQVTVTPAAEKFMRRMVGDERWEALPERTRETRRIEGATMVGELADLCVHRPWDAADVHVPVVAAYGEHASPHHRHGMAYVADHIDGARLVELPGCRHDAPLSHPATFAERIVFPLLDLLVD